MTISLGQLDLEALKNYLKIVQGFRTVEDHAKDTEQVAGIDAENIARAALINDQLIEGRRDLVQAALGLVSVKEDGTIVEVPADDFITNEEGMQIYRSAVDISVNTADDMRALRNEMYHLKRDMIRLGMLPDGNVYNGFVDPFLNELSILDEIGVSATGTTGQQNKVQVNDNDIMKAKSYSKGQYLALLQDGVYSVLDVINDTDQNGIILSGNTIVGNENTAVKSIGVCDKGRFVFGTKNPFMSSENAIQAIVKDGVTRINVMDIGINGIDGFATKITVTSDMNGAILDAVRIALKSTDLPGVCYIELYDFNDEIVNNFSTQEPIAVTNHINAGQANGLWNTYKFTFNESVLLQQGAQYLMLVKTLNGQNGHWSVGGFNEVCEEGVHIDTFIYSDSTKLLSPIVKNNNITGVESDMFLSLYTIKQNEENQSAIEPLSKGLYTGRFLLEDGKATRVRVSFNPRKFIECYTVTVKGIKDNGDFMEVLTKGYEEARRLSHRVEAAGEMSADEYVFDFDLQEAAREIEFQIFCNLQSGAQNDNYEALYSLVVSTDDAHVEGDE